MNLDFNTSKPLQYIIYLLLFITGQSLSMWGQYVTLPFKNLTYWQAFSMAIPFAWADWFFMTFAVDIGHRYKLVTPTQDTFLLIILQFTLVLLINQFYLKQTFLFLNNILQKTHTPFLKKSRSTMEIGNPKINRRKIIKIKR